MDKRELTDEERRRFEEENTLLGAYREFFKNDMRDVIRQEMCMNVNHEERISNLELWNIKIAFKSFTVYVVPIAAIAALFGVIYLIINNGN